ncbi:SusC/RagA family TonB-linked outer membrane protein [Wenyingzhuangia marina]|uniref:Iron complex outermembrane recepter protein n=1 Tax=Wenyingzhuangia marina TaxID=1195760 RepID=A0A1M5T956_9FLAO|nr:SusC/RagA family TonB-linked outer membrane protein [Wenyingzhuangia marina]GGF65869.1 SusC/RagA family TonB-linked outer membrane protein [Wenyingzhuangia marina]SHH47251.1 iron complex outermembrane recepter protein [Wenyingzhuangia marina]
MKKTLLILFATILIPVGMMAQKTVSGIVKDKATDLPIGGVSILIENTNKGTITDFDGNYNLQLDDNDPKNIVISYLGYKTQILAIPLNGRLDVVLEEDVTSLTAVNLTVGYGSMKKDDMTGSADLVTTKDFNPGPVQSPQQLITGKVAGVTVTSGSGAPGDKQNIVIRGVGSLSLSSAPLIVLDGIPLSDSTVGGARDVLNTINPNDVESMVVLKDASATSIYGSRGANGVILITTKRGKNGAFKFSYNTMTSVATPFQKADVLGADEFRQLVTSLTKSADIAKLGSANTDWQDQIYQTAFGQQHDFSALGSFLNTPMRFSVGYSDQDGILKTDNFKRTTASLNLSPSFFEDHLKIEINGRGNYTENFFANRGAISSASDFDPTQSVYDPNSIFDGYYAWTGTNGYQLNLVPTNPVALLNLVSDSAEVRRFIGNTKVDYKLHFFPDVTATLNAGVDMANSNGRKVTSASIPTSDTSFDGSRTEYINESTNTLLDFYLTYQKDFDKHGINLVGGYSFQKFDVDNYNYDSEKEQNGNDFEFIDKNRNTLLSYFGRLNYDFDGKYLLTATLRADASSKLNPDNRWGLFSSFAAAWNIHKESFLEGNQNINELKLRLGYGEVGNVNGLGDYLFLTRYSGSQSTANYQFGSQYYQTYRPNPVNTNLRWEVGRTYNAGIDYAFFNRKISGSLNVYLKETQDLIANTVVDPFTNFGNRIDANIGDMENKGIEFSINWKTVSTETLKVNLGYNIAYNNNQVTRLPDQQFVGGISGGTGNNVQTHIEGAAPFSYLVYQQLYDTNGKPIEGAYVDRDHNGVINDKDKYLYKNPYANVTMGFNTSIQYRSIDFNMVTRASLGNYVYNNVSSSKGYANRLNETSILNNINRGYFTTEFKEMTQSNLLSDHYVENASFFKIDNITLGYTLPKVFEKVKIRLYSSVQNVLTITDYSGIDPEVNLGIDNNLYPRPRTYVFGLNVNF